MFDLEENFEVEDIESVPEEYKGLYEEGGEKGYKIADNVKPLVEAYSGTTKSLNKERSAKSKANEEAKTRRHSLSEVESILNEAGFEIGDEEVPNVVKNAITDLQGKAKNGEQVKVDLDKVRSEMQKKQEELSNSKDQEISARDKALEKIMIKGAAQSELAEAKGNTKLLMPHIANHTKVMETGKDDDGVPVYEVRVLDEDGDFRTDGKGGYMGVKDLVQEMKSSKDFASAFESETPGGGGAKPGPSTRKPSGSQDKNANQKISSGLENRSRR